MLESFFIFGDLPPQVETGDYQPLLILLSFIVASFASYTALAMAQQVIGARDPREKRLLLWGGAFAMGAGIWAMHFIGMLSYKMRMVVTYDPFLTLCSMIIAIGFSYGVLEIVARQKLSMRQIAAGGVLLGIGICSMHYTGMMAMEMDGELRHTPGLFLLSAAIAIVASGVALWTAFTLSRHNSYFRNLLQVGAALILGAAICGMHYTGMAASVFIPYADCRYDPNQDFSMLALMIAGITSIILGLAIAVGIYRRTHTIKALLAAIVESSDDAVISKTLDSIITSWNAGAERLFGYTAAEAVGQHVRLIIPMERMAEEAQIISRMLEGQTIEHFETVRRKKGGQRVDVSMTVSPIRDSSGQTIGASSIARDITERKEAEAKLLKYMRALEISNQELDDFAHIASHDLKEPLRGMYNHATFMKEDYEGKMDADGMQRLERIQLLAKKMERLVSDLLYFSQLGRQDLAVQETDPNLLIEEIRQMLDSFLKERNATIEVPLKLPTIICDKPRVTEVFRNLITNAVKYNDKSEKRVEVGFLDNVETPEGFENDVFYVKDNGIGIEARYHEEIFRIFKRLHRDEVRETGSGAGLTFVKKIIERHQGRIWLDSTPGVGTTFYFNLNRDGKPL